MIKRNRNFLILAAAILGILAWGCDDRNDTYYPHDNTAPPVPTGVGSITMDEAVELYWDPVVMDSHDDDLNGYRVYISNDNHIFDPVTTVGRDVTNYTFTSLINGHTYYFAVTSFDYRENESELSLETVYDTPRPEGFDQVIYSFNDANPNYRQISGFDFQSEVAVPWNHRDCDFYMEYDTTLQTFYLWVVDGYKIQDMGYTDNFDEITYAPNTGWSNFLYIEAISGHTYVILTADNHYAKVRITQRAFDPTFKLVFDWGYQIDAGNRELKIENPIHTSGRSDDEKFF